MYEVFIYWLCKYFGVYLVVLGYIDVVSFIVGIGENDVVVWWDVLVGF